MADDPVAGEVLAACLAQLDADLKDIENVLTSVRLIRAAAENIRDLVAGILEDEGFSTRTARDSDSALAEIANRLVRLPRMRATLARGAAALVQLAGR